MRDYRALVVHNLHLLSDGLLHTNLQHLELVLMLLKFILKTFETVKKLVDDGDDSDNLFQLELIW